MSPSDVAELQFIVARLGSICRANNPDAFKLIDFAALLAVLRDPSDLAVTAADIARALGALLIETIEAGLAK